MTPQEIIEGNKLIAEFMGLHYDKGDWRDDKNIIHWLGSELESDMIPYHSSWDWLMPVVEKIESLGFYFNIKKNHVVVAWDNKGTRDSEMIHSEWGNQTKRERVFQCVVAFIKWYNQNKVSKASKPCPNCNETEQPCACMRNICHKCGKPVGNITFTICDECWDIKFPPKK